MWPWTNPLPFLGLLFKTEAWVQILPLPLLNWVMWANHLIFLIFNFLICKMDLLMVPTADKVKWKYKIKHLAHIRSYQLLLILSYCFLVFFCFLFFVVLLLLFACTNGIQKFQGQGSNPRHSSESAGSLTHWATRELQYYHTFNWIIPRSHSGSVLPFWGVFVYMWEHFGLSNDWEVLAFNPGGHSC